MSFDPTVLHVVGARPNFMKVAPVLRALRRRAFGRQVLVHTGQHYDDAMSSVFFDDLDLPDPDVHLGVGSASHARQTADVLRAIEPVLEAYAPDLVMVVGDVNSTLAAALAAAKLNRPVAHLEAGLRSGDRTMPEEINRLLTDQLAELLLTPSRDADRNLEREGVPPDRIHFVGNVMIDSLERVLPKVRSAEGLEALGVADGEYAAVTLHRPSNVDDARQLADIFQALDEIAAEVPVLFPMHPRTRARAAEFGLTLDAVRVMEPVGYETMLILQAHAAVVLTDSGGMQEETTVLGVPCLTLRENTERPVTITEGTNRLVPRRTPEAIVSAFRAARTDGRNPRRPERWDGRAAERVADAIEKWAERRGVRRGAAHV